MIYTVREMVWLFLCYSFAGWVMETVFSSIHNRKVTNRGLINGPFCTIYGFGAIVITVFLYELTGIWLFIFSAAYASVIEWAAGHLIEKLYHEKWWDYSKRFFNIGGYTCLSASVFWGILGYATIRWGNVLLIRLYLLVPSVIMGLIVWVIAALLAADMIFSIIILKYRGQGIEQIERSNEEFTKISTRLRNRIIAFTDRRIIKAYPKAEKVNAADKTADSEEKYVFAAGCGFYKLTWLLIVGAFIGDIVETIFCRITAGVWMSRSSVVWGPFSLVWGIAIAAATLMLYKYRDRSDGFIFAVGTFLGGAYEYLCSVFTEIVFGKVFWDYSSIPFNLGGRINLLYCFFWGIAAVVWLKKLYPPISALIEKIPVKAGKCLTWLLVIFMLANISVTCVALVRYDQRAHGIEAQNELQEWADVHYNDSVMKKIYPNAKMAE